MGRQNYKGSASLFSLFGDPVLPALLDDETETECCVPELLKPAGTCAQLWAHHALGWVGVTACNDEREAIDGASGRPTLAEARSHRTIIVGNLPTNIRYQKLR